jgi:hypothetical protein
MQPAGQDPEARLVPGTVTVPLHSRTNANPFWIIIVAGRSEHANAGVCHRKRDPVAAVLLSSSARPSKLLGTRHPVALLSEPIIFVSWLSVLYEQRISAHNASGGHQHSVSRLIHEGGNHVRLVF